ncbi:MAG: hypothetical protein JO257_13760 [Deltaproteobacteria bacterium]|nr:hypothetical protein [Deltaproteobacteria bacterium]
MGEKKTPRSTIVIGAAAVGGVIAVNVAQKYAWALESSTNTALVAVGAAVVCGVIAWVVTRPRRA